VTDVFLFQIERERDKERGRDILVRVRRML
jgi:hypothetical protein